MEASSRHRLIVLAAVALIVGAGLCIFDASHGTTVGTDLCLSLLVTAAIPLLVPLSPRARLVPVRAASHYFASLELIVPPPRG